MESTFLSHRIAFDSSETQRQSTGVTRAGARIELKATSNTMYLPLEVLG
jgi:hypothetical protein